MTSYKDKKTALILCILLGYLGIHRFYVGKGKSGSLYFLTFGVFGIGWIMDIIAILNDSFTDSLGYKLVGQKAPKGELYFPPNKPSNSTIAISEEERAKLTAPIKGYKLKYHYKDVKIAWFDNLYELPSTIKAGNRVIFIQEPTNQYDNRAVLLLFAPQKAPFGYLHRGTIQDMVNDYIDRGDKVVARLSSLQTSPHKKITIDISFFQKSTN